MTPEQQLAWENHPDTTHCWDLECCKCGSVLRITLSNHNFNQIRHTYKCDRCLDREGNPRYYMWIDKFGEIRDRIWCVIVIPILGIVLLIGIICLPVLLILAAVGALFTEGLRWLAKQFPVKST